MPFAGSQATLELFLNEMYSGVTKEEVAGEAEEGEAAVKFLLHGDQVSSFTFPTIRLFVV